jgi:opacity protein-like surface antigen
MCSMKKIILFSVLVLSMLVSVNAADAKTVKVKGYYKPSTGTYVSPSYRTSPNKVKFDNYSSKGNYNPYSGKKGYKSW